MIRDEFTDLPISRQRKYQLRRRRDLRCIKCGKPTDGMSVCQEHRTQAKDYYRQRQCSIRPVFCIFGH